MSLNPKKRTFFFPVLLTLIGIHFIYMFVFSDNRSLWYDDIFQIYFVGNNQTMEQSVMHLLRTDLNPPIWGIISKIWITVAPYGTKWIRLISEIGVSIGIFFVALSGRKAWSDVTGLIGTGLCIVSSNLITQAAYALRCYGWAFCFASIFLYFYITREKNKTFTNTMTMSTAMVLFASTHYFGVFTAMITAIVDLFGIIVRWFRRERVSLGEFILTFLPYALSFVVMLPWVIAQFFTISSAMGSFWPSVPDFDSVNDVFLFLSSDQSTFFKLFLSGAFLSIVMVLINVDEKFPMVCYLVPIGLVLGIFAYSRFFGSSSVWVLRYFICIMPFFILGAAWTLSVVYQVVQKLIEKANPFEGSKAIVPCILCGLLVFQMFVSIDKIVPYVRTVYEPFEEVADGLLSRPDVLDDDTLVYVTTPNGDGWRYYLSENGTRDIEGLNLIDNPTMKYFPFMDFSRFETIYYFKVHWKEKITMDYTALEQKLALTHTGVRLDLPGEVYCYTRIPIG